MNNIIPIVISSVLGLITTYLLYVVRRQKERIDTLLIPNFI